MPEVLPSLLVLAVMAVVALWLTISRGGVGASAAAVQPAVRVAAIAIAVQAGVASVANGLLHPLLALNAGGYFPGLATSPLVAVVGGLLLARLSRVTA